jgi:diguanylate cyclase
VSLTVIAVVAVAASIGAPVGWYIGMLRRNLAAARYDATHDPLTGLTNRRPLIAAITGHINAGHRFAVVLADIDRFKQLNDAHGHDAGDAILVQLACRLPAAGEGISHIIRLGGDEVVLLVTGDDDHAIAVGKTLWQQVAGEPFVLPSGHPIDIAVSVGVASHTLGTDPATLLRQADTALATAKPIGTVMHWHPGASVPPTSPRPRHRHRDLTKSTPPAPAGVTAWRCWFAAAAILGLAQHATTMRHHRRNATEEELLQDCPGGLEIITEGGYVTAYSTGWPAQLRNPHDPDSIVGVDATATDGAPQQHGAHLPHIAHIHLDPETMDALQHAADWDGGIEVTVTGDNATFTLTRNTTIRP